MVRDTPSSQDASTHQIWNSYLKEYRRYAPDTKQDGWTDGWTDGRTVRLLYASESSFGGIKMYLHSVLLVIADDLICHMTMFEFCLTPWAPQRPKVPP